MALNGAQTLVDSITERTPRPGYVKKVLESVRSEVGLFNVGRRPSLRNYASHEAHRASPGAVPSSTSGDSQNSGSKGSGGRPKSEGADRYSSRNWFWGSSLRSSKVGPLFLDNEEVRNA